METYLAHYGILGQKWGVRRWQEKDGSYNQAGLERYFGSDHRQRKAEVKDARRQLRSAKKEYSKDFKEYYNSNGKNRLNQLEKTRQSEAEWRAAKESYAKSKRNDEIESHREKMLKRYSGKDSEMYEKYKNASQDDLADEAHKAKVRKAILIGSAAAAAAVTAYGAYKLYDLKTAKIDPDTGLRLLNSKLTDAQILNRINPGKIKLGGDKRLISIIRGSGQNCMLCTTSYELQKRGYDVKAGTSTTGFMPHQLFPKIYSDYKGVSEIQFRSHEVLKDGLYRRPINPAEKLKIITDTLSKEPDGARGNIMVYWQRGGGHSMIWEKVNGEIRFMDGQTNQVYTDFAKTILSHTADHMPAHVLRTDNLTLNPAGIKEFMNNGSTTDFILKEGAKTAVATATATAGKVMMNPLVLAAAGNVAAYKIAENRGVTGNASSTRKNSQQTGKKT